MCKIAENADSISLDRLSKIGDGLLRAKLLACMRQFFTAEPLVRVGTRSRLAIYIDFEKELMEVRKWTECD